MKTGDPLLFKKIMLAMGTVGGVLLLVKLLSNSKRKEQFKALADHNGFEYFEDGNSLKVELSTAHFIKTSDNARISNAIALFHPETDIRRAFIFDFHYSRGRWWNMFTHRSLIMDMLIGLRKNHTPQYHTQTVFACFLQRANLPRIHIEPKIFINRIEPLNELENLKVESQKEFSKKFLVSTDNSEQSLSLFTPSTCQLLIDRTPGFSFEMEGKWLFAYKRDRTVKATNFPDVLEAVEAVAFALYQSNLKQELINLA